jgi:Domain of unknown function (DUF4383)
VVKSLGVFMGSAFLFGGLLGFVPGVVKDGMYFGIFMVNTPHNILHIVSGAIFLIASMIGASAARLWFEIFGLVYAGMAAWGFQVGDGIICGMISNNRYDSWGHAALALAMLLIGFALPKQSSTSGRVRYVGNDQ